MARIACVYSVEEFNTVERPLKSWCAFPFGLSIIAAALQAAGHQMRCWVICPATNLEAVAQEIVSVFGSDIVAATAVSTQFPIIDRLLEAVKRANPRVPTLLGGHHATLVPDKAIASPWVDAICVGEGEKSSVAYAAAVDEGRQPASIPGMWIKTADASVIDRTPPEKFNVDLDQLPFIDRSHWARWVDPVDKSFVIVVGRGCPFVCAYCSNHALKDVTTGKFVRFRSADNVIEEISETLRNFPETDFIYLEVETIGALPKVAIELCDRLARFNRERQKAIEFGTNLALTTSLASKPEQIDALLSAFRRANISRVNVGLESGSERIRNEVLKRPRYTNEELVRFCRLAKHYGIGVQLFVLMGLPTETPREYLETVQVARDCDPLGVYPSIFYPYPGTKLFKLAADMKLFDPATINPNAERSRAYLNLPGFSKWRIFLEYVIVYWRVYHGRWPATHILSYTVRQLLMAVPGLLSLMNRVVRKVSVVRAMRNKVRHVGMLAVPKAEGEGSSVSS